MTRPIILAAATGALALTSAAPAGLLFTYSDASGLGAEAEFTADGSSTLVIRLKNTSTGVPGGFSNSDQLLTGVSWDFGPAGVGGITITGGTVFTGPDSASINFDILNVGANADVSGEYGYGNMDTTGLLWNMVSTVTAGTTLFGGANLDGPIGTNGPQAGLVADPILVALGGLGAIQDEIIITLSLSDTITEAQLLQDLLDNGTVVEFGSDAAFITGVYPAPGTVALLAVAGLVGRRRRRRR